MQVQRVMPGMKSSQPQIRTEKKPNEATIVNFNQLLSRKTDYINRIIDENIERHINWNKGWTDATWNPLLPHPGYTALNDHDGMYCGKFIIAQGLAKSEPSLVSIKGTSPGRKVYHRGTATDALSSTLSMRNNGFPRRRKGRGGRLLVDCQLRRPIPPADIMSKTDWSDEPSLLARGYENYYYNFGNHSRYSKSEINNASLNDDSAFRYRVLIRTSASRDNIVNAA